MNIGLQPEMLDGKPNSFGNIFPYLNISLLVFIADQLSKLIILKYLKESLVVIPNFFNLVLVHNRGAAWGMFSKYPGLLTAIAFIALFIFIFFFEKISDGRPNAKIGLSLLIGGIMGNLFDRLIRGAVVDFLDFYFKGYHWPAFNIADSAITISVFILLLSSLRKEDNKADDHQE